MLLRTIAFSFAALLCAVPLVFAQENGQEPAVFSNDYPAGTPRVKAACSLLPIKYIIDRIGGEYIDSLALIPAGFEPHTFEPKSSQLAAFSQADVYFSLEMPVERLWLGRFSSLGEQVHVVSLMEPLAAAGLLLAETDDHAHGSDDGTGAGHTPAGDNDPAHDGESSGAAADEENQAHFDYDGYDPHVWMAPSLLKLLADTVKAGLSEQMPEQAAYFEKNCRTLLRQIEGLDERVKKILSALPAEKRSFLVFHPSWTYFAKEYGLVQMAIEQDGKEPTPMSLAMIIQDARKTGIGTIFVQKEFNPGVAATVASHLPDGRVEILDPLGANPLRAIQEAAAAISGQDESESGNGGQ